MSGRWQRRSMVRRPLGILESRGPQPTLGEVYDAGVEISADDDRLVLSPYVSDDSGVTVHVGPVITLDGVSDEAYVGMVVMSALGLTVTDSLPLSDHRRELQRALRVRSARALVSRPRATVRRDRMGNLVVRTSAPNRKGEDWVPGPGSEVVVEADADPADLARTVRAALDSAAKNLDKSK